LVALLKRSGRKRGIDAEAARPQVFLRAGYLHQPRLVEDAYGRQTRALLRLLDAACTSAEELETAAAASFDQHPDAAIITSLPGLAALTGARILAEIGDDRSRFADARSLNAYSGAAPVTRASGKSRHVMIHWSRTSASPRSDTSGRSPRSTPHPAPAHTTTAAACVASG
jgi:transposase